jgi:formylglycine-generating enzyme required for sulfatase activity
VNQIYIDNRFVMSNSISPTGRNGIACDKDQDSLNLPITFYCDLNNNVIPNESADGQNVACNYLSWADGAAYADWAGLRPMTELEFEKVCRGPEATVYQQYVWGNTSICNQTYSLLNNGTSLESVYIDNLNGNTLYNATMGTEFGPYRCGIFAQGTTNRMLSGATYYGLMDMSGNVEERVVTLGNAEGRAFQGTLGDGQLNTLGNATNTDWPGIDATPANGVTGALGSGSRGGSLVDAANYLAISFRQHGAFTYTGRNISSGFRAVR